MDTDPKIPDAFNLDEYLTQEFNSINSQFADLEARYQLLVDRNNNRQTDGEDDNATPQANQ